MEKNIDCYTYRVTWSPNDNKFIGTCAEFPSLRWVASTREYASNGICNLVFEAIKDMRLLNKQIPEPIAFKHNINKLLV